MSDAASVDLALLLLRLVLGGLLVFHGMIKFRQKGGIANSGRYFESMGLRPGLALGWATALGLIATGGCLIVGFLTSLAGLGAVGLMTVAWWTVRRGRGVLVAKGGWEYCLVIGVIGVALATTGPGSASLDEMFGTAWPGWSGLLISAGGGLLAAVAVIRVFYEPSDLPYVIRAYPDFPPSF